MRGPVTIAARALLGGLLAMTATAGSPRLRRADAFLGIHFDFHAGPDCTNVGARTTPEMVGEILDQVHPDYIQIDCKGHRGYCSYPTRVGNPAPGIVGDPLRIWREVTRARGVSLFMHYSGVWDYRAIELHPDWAARNADGKPNSKATSVFGPYADALLIPQLRELAGVHGVDGAWVDGDCWGATLDYGDAPVQAFRTASGAAGAPRKAGEPFWDEWKEFNREGFRRYLRRYVDALRQSHPDFEVISNWAFSDHMPEPVTANVAALSGDFAPDDSVNSARFAGRCIENQGRPWDLMSWSFSRRTRKQKPAPQLMQEAAIVLAQGGGYQAYFTQNRDGSVRLGEMGVMAEVARFCRERQAVSHRSVAVPQVALLYSTPGHYRSSDRLFHPSGGDGIGVLRTALKQILAARYGVQIVSEHHLTGAMSNWPVIVVPGWSRMEPAFCRELAAYANAGGRLLLVGDGPARLFEGEKAAADPRRLVFVPAPDAALTDALRRLFPEPVVRVEGPGSIDVSPRRTGDRFTVHLVNTGGPHEQAPDGGIADIPPAGPLTVSIARDRAPKSVTVQPGGSALPVRWSNGRATVTLPRLDLSTILVVED